MKLSQIIDLLTAIEKKNETQEVRFITPENVEELEILDLDWVDEKDNKVEIFLKKREDLINEICDL